MGLLSNLFGKKQTESNASVNFEVSMSCMNCVKHVQNFLSEEKGVADFQVDLDSKNVSIQYDKGIIDDIQLKKDLEELGFTVTKK